MSGALPDTDCLRQSIIDACLEMNQTGINQGTSGNISVRVEGGMLITPSGVDYRYMTRDMLVFLEVDQDPVPGGPKPSSEWRFHRDILAAKPDVQAIVHAHPVYCTALAMNRREIPACHYMVAAFGGHSVPVADYALFGTDKLSEFVLSALRERSGCLMANHGALVTGDSLARAMWRMVELETLAKGYITSLSIGSPTLLTDEEMAEVETAFSNYGLKTR